MADDKNKVGQEDRRTVSASETYEVMDFAQAAGISAAQGRQLIKEHGNDRAKLMEAAKKLMAERRSA